MHFFYGQLAWQPNAATTQEGVAQMMAALATYPWKEGGALPLIVQNGDGALAIQQAGEAGRSLSRPLHQNGLTIAADVRLDNRAELLTALGMHPAQGATLSDPELLLHAYRRWGIECPQHLLGDFAFALWDESQQRLLCARDFVGTRPFYYQQRPGQGFVCASDLRALLAHPDVPQRLNLAYVKAELLTGMGPGAGRGLRREDAPGRFFLPQWAGGELAGGDGRGAGRGPLRRPHWGDGSLWLLGGLTGIG